MGLSWLVTLALAGAVLPTESCGGQTPPPAGPSILEARGATLELRLMDAWNGQPAAGVLVKVSRDNGVRCIAAPCPTDAAEWSGQTDERGVLTVPRTALGPSTYLAADRYQTTDLIQDALPDHAGWVAELVPRELAERGALGVRGYKLIDGRSGEPLANRHVRVEFAEGEPLDTTTNALGYLFFPFELSVSSGRPTAWVSSTGFRRAKLDFGAGPRGTRLRAR